jgi:hypothetical protein
MSVDTTNVDSFAHNRMQQKIAKEQAELEALLKGETEDGDGEVQQESTEEAAEPSSREPVEASVPDEGDTQQEEEPKAEAQEELTAEEKSFKKRYGDLRRHMQEKDNEFKAKMEALEAKLDKAASGSIEELTTKEQISEWAKQNPKANSLIRALAEEQAAEQMKSLDSRLKEVEEMRTQARKEKAEAELMSLHPDFVDIRNDDAFHEWANEQPKWAQEALYDTPDDIKSVARVLDLYKVDKGIKTKKVAPDKAAASSVRSRTAAKPEADETKSYLSESAVSKMSMKEYESRIEEIMEAQRSGKFIYDMS